jgi:hypothetical protein
LAVVDASNTVIQGDDLGYRNGNNFVIGSTVTVTTTANLAKSSVYGQNNFRGNGIWINGTVSNLDLFVAVSGAIVTFFLSSEAVLGSTDIQLSSSYNIGTLNPSQSKSFAKSLSVPRGTTAGDYYVIAVVDYDNKIVEFDNQYNNIAVSNSLVRVF